MRKRIANSNSRTPEQIREHYKIEKELASRLRNASKEERRYLYISLYNELYRRVPHHPQLSRKADAKTQFEVVSGQIRLLEHFLNPVSVFMEIGPGDCRLSLEIAKFIKKVYAVDVSEEITKNLIPTENFELIISDGCSIPVPENSINIAYSYQLIEHLHPDDAHEQIRNVYRALTQGGIYICITPNRLNGPHDISAYFDEVATGFHLKEYTTTELSDIFKAAGFSKVQVCISIKGYLLLLPVFPVKWCEYFLIMVPPVQRRKIANWLPARLILGITLIATK